MTIDKQKWLDAITEEVSKRLQLRTSEPKTKNEEKKPSANEDTDDKLARRLWAEKEEFLEAEGCRRHLGLWHMRRRLPGPRLFTTLAAVAFLQGREYRPCCVIGPYSVSIATNEDKLLVTTQAAKNYHELLAANGHTPLFNESPSMKDADDIRYERDKARLLDNRFQAIGINEYRFTLD